MIRTTLLTILACLAALHSPATAQAQSFVNWENRHVHPLDITPDGSTLLAVNTADGRLEIFDLSGASPTHLGMVPVGIAPVSVRARSNTQAWVVNHISDSVSIVDLTTLNVVATLDTLDEPCDVVFAGAPEMAYVSCAQVNTVIAFDTSDFSAAAIEIAIDAEEPHAMAVSAAGDEVYVAIFESGNRSTILGGGSLLGGGFPPNVVSDPAGPYVGVNPPPNAGPSFDPLQNPANPPPPAVGLIVKKNASGQWMDDNAGDWTDLVSGASAAVSGRPVGWDLPDRDVAIIDTTTHDVTYATGLMNICMALAVNPASGALAVVGTDAINEVRYEPILSGRFTRVNFASFDPASPGAAGVVDLNQHLDYSSSTISQTERDKSIGDPRAIVWNAAGDRAYVSGMGTNNVIVIDAAGNRAGLSETIEVGEGATGLVLDEPNNRLYVLNKFASTISVIDTTAEAEISQVAFFDPSPPAIKIGRKHLYDAHKNSGLGHISCASCHLDARMDRLAWDLGAPDGDMAPFDQNCNAGVLGGCTDWHPMKGPMTTQTLQDIIGKEPHHWRGDRDGLEEFNPAFMGLLGDDDMLTAAEMQEFEDFLATITFPPNPFRNFDNTMPISLPLPGHFTPGRFAPAGQPLPDGNAVSGLNLYRTADLDGVDCVSCHTLPTGVGSNHELSGIQFVPISPGPNGELHHNVVSVDGSTNISIKVPQLRNLYDKVGLELTQPSNAAGFGFLHDGSVDSIARFVAEPVFSVSSDQQIADLVAFMLAFSGSDLPVGSAGNPNELPGPTSKDSHAATGTQITFDGTNNTDPQAVGLLDDMVALADEVPDSTPGPMVGLVAKGVQGGLQRGYRYAGLGLLRADRQTESISVNDLRLAAAVGSEVTFTLVSRGTQLRIGVDRDEDGFLDRDELEGCSDPADAESIPSPVLPYGDVNGSFEVDLDDLMCMLEGLSGLFSCPGAGFDQLDIEPCAGDGDLNLHDLIALLDALAGAPACPASCS